jgi:hypothetical protein
MKVEEEEEEKENKNKETNSLVADILGPENTIIVLRKCTDVSMEQEQV